MPRFRGPRVSEGGEHPRVVSWPAPSAECSRPSLSFRCPSLFPFTIFLALVFFLCVCVCACVPHCFQGFWGGVSFFTKITREGGSGGNSSMEWVFPIFFNDFVGLAQGKILVFFRGGGLYLLYRKIAGEGGSEGGTAIWNDVEEASRAIGYPATSWIIPPLETPPEMNSPEQLKSLT